MKKRNLKKIFKTFIISTLLLPCTFLFCACGNSNDDLLAKINSMQAQINALESANRDSNSQIDTYDMYLQAVENDEFTGSYLDFIKQNITVANDTTSIVANKCTASVVSIQAKDTENGGGTNGSGIIYSLDQNGNAIIVTNYHLAYSPSTANKARNIFELYLYGADSTKKINATFVGGSADYDLAVLKVTESGVLKNSGAMAVSFDTSNTKLGTTCLAIGNPNADGISITRGIVSRDSEQVNMTVAEVTKKRRVIRHDAYITNGSSGGGLFDMNGNLIGLTNGGERDENHINYAIPSSIVYAVTQNILKNCGDGINFAAKTTTLNAITVGSETQTTYNSQTGFIDIVDTVIFAEIQDTSILKTTNVIASGDKIKTIIINEGTAGEIKKDITRAFEIKELLLYASAGDTLKIVVERNGQTLSTTMTVRASDIISVA